MDDFTRQNPPTTGPERAILDGFLDYHRATLLQKVAGLSEADMRRVMSPSSMSLMGLVKHLAYVERWWFQAVFAGLEITFPWSDADPDADFRPEPEDTVESVLALYRAEVSRSREITAAAELDDLARGSQRGERSLRWIIIHMIEETARHNGHADIFREMIDGTNGE